ncbi:hypothetical protein LOTGIDRAFT_234029 [Lottia gigantea]|uniref:Uncharacterized protein n=1 Tax=Lottia gigantea TaxID=225164 RepID=V4A4K4_LOTGI|nr:hypothetical protein LOTGIDRAFT_234029 [Lottia gigantea]ESO89900.1 hypothetical protein LOTGIDRAFT_234029 [Lottia gigantea]
MKQAIFLVVLLTEVMFINGQIDMVNGLVDMNKVRKFYDILKKSCCSYQPNECMDQVSRKKRRTNPYSVYPTDDDGDDDRIDRFENCLCKARKQSQKCQLEFKVNKSKKRIDSKKSYRVVFHWHEEFKEFKCRIQQDRTIECQFYKKTTISSKLRDDVELLVTYHTVEKSECRTVCDTISCAYEADEQSDFDFYNDNMQHHFDICMDPPLVMSTTNAPISTTSDIPVDQTSTTKQSVLPGLQTTTPVTNDGSGSGKIKGGKDRSDVPDISGLVGGIVGGLLVAILIIIAIIFYIFRFKGKRTLSRSTSEPIDRKHSVIQETLSDNIYSVMEEPVYQDPSCMVNDNRTIRDNEPIVRSDSMLDPSYVNLAMSNSPVSSQAQIVPTAPYISPRSPTIAILPPTYINKKPPTAPKPILLNVSKQTGTPNQTSSIIHHEPNSPTTSTTDYHVYEHVIPTEQEDNKYEQLKQYEQLGAAPYYIGATEFNPKVAIPKTTPGFSREDSRGYTEPEISNCVIYNAKRPEYIELESDSGYSLAKDVE